MHISCYQGDNNLSLKIGQVASDEDCKLIKLLDVDVQPLLKREWIVVILRNGSLGGCAPLNLSNGGDNLALLLKHELLTVLVGVLLVCIVEQVLESSNHVILHVIEPFLNQTLDSTWLLELDILLLI